MREISRLRGIPRRFARDRLLNERSHLQSGRCVRGGKSIVAWNIYPFQPSQTVDWCFTILMLCLSTSFIKVFAEMHRNPILSRITATKSNELGIDFYIRLVAFGAAPVLTWLAYQVPEIGGRILRLLQPSLQVTN